MLAPSSRLPYAETMYHITTTTVGKQKPGPIAELIAEYQKRLSPYAKLVNKIIKEERFNEKTDKEKVKEVEANNILNTLETNTTNILLTEHGKTLNTHEFTQALSAWTENGARHINFVIAGPLGIPESLQNKFDHTLSLSPMTFPHEIASLLLHEQLYRAATIQAGKTYHY